MIYCVSFSDVEAFLLDAGFRLAGQTDSHLLYRSVDGTLTVHRPNQNGDVTQIEFEQACDNAGIAPPALDIHWYD